MTEIKKILIVYPKEFLCYKKFKRKLDYYTSNSGKVELIGLFDENEFSKKGAKESSFDYFYCDNEKEAIDRYTHAIIFDDRKRYRLLRASLKEKGKVIRVVPLEITIVVNKDRGDAYDVYIGRGTIWGNPYQIGPNGDREEVIRKFSYDFDRGFLKFSDNLEKNIYKLKGKVIACHCKPYPCHGDVIAAYINSFDDGK
jgi:hypothetical protein